MIPSPEELDKQSAIKLDGWVEVDSERWKEVDDEPALTKRWLKMGFMSPPFFFADSLGRVWGKSEDGTKWFPFHLEYGKKLYGIRVSTRAAN